MNKELLPCPFCGSTDIRPSNKTSAGGSVRHMQMFCNSCHAYGPRLLKKVDKKKYYSSDEWRNMVMDSEAVDLWNGRPEGKVIQ